MNSVLILDDHSFFVDGLTLSLSQMFGCVQVECLADLSKVRAFLQIKPVDLIILDPDFKAANGADAPAMIEMLKHSAPVVVMAEYVNPERVHCVMESGAAAYLEKRTAKSCLADCLQAVRQGRMYLPGPVSLALQQYRSIALPVYQAVDEQLSERQKEVLVLLANGYSNHDISASLGITQSTVKFHVSRLMHIFDVDNRTGCVAEAKQMGIL